MNNNCKRIDYMINCMAKINVSFLSSLLCGSIQNNFNNKIKEMLILAFLTNFVAFLNCTFLDFNLLWFQQEEEEEYLLSLHLRIDITEQCPSQIHFQVIRSQAKQFSLNLYQTTHVHFQKKNKAKILSRSVNIGQAIRNCLEIIDHLIKKNSYLHTTFCKRIFDC